MLPTISVVVPSYNQADFLPEALESIFCQEYPKLEVIVIDGGSDDDSVPIIRRYQHKLKYWQSEPDGGQSAAINAGMRYAEGELVAWLNSDDFYFADALWQVARAYAAHPGRGLYVGNGFRFDQATKMFTPFCPRHVAFDRAALELGTDFLLQPSVFFLREAWEDVGGLDEQLHYCMDWDIFIRIAKKYPCVVINEFLACSREYPATKTSTGRMRRAAEIVGMIARHTHRELTPGSLLYLVETLEQVTRLDFDASVPKAFAQATAVLARNLSQRFGGGHGFPECTDPQDVCYLPLPDKLLPQKPKRSQQPTLLFSLIIPSGNATRESLQRSLDSIRQQEYGSVETIVVCDEAFPLPQCTDDIVLVRVPTSNEAKQIRAGLAQAKGEVLCWLLPGDQLAANALSQVADSFTQDQSLDWVLGNALHLDASSRLDLAHHGRFASAAWFPPRTIATDSLAANCDPYIIPSAAFFFHRRWLPQIKWFNPRRRFYYALPFWHECLHRGQGHKIEQVLALCLTEETDWAERFVEFFRVTRPAWWKLLAPPFRHNLRLFLHILRRGPLRKLSERLSRNLLTALFEAKSHVKSHLFPSREASRIASALRRLECTPTATGKPSVLLFGRQWADDLLHRLGCFSELDAFVLDDPAPLKPYCKRIHTPSSLCGIEQHVLKKINFPTAWRTRIALALRRRGIPVFGPHYPFVITQQMPFLRWICRQAIQNVLDTKAVDFLFVAPHDNPIAVDLDTRFTNTRLILCLNELLSDELLRRYHAAWALKRPALMAEYKRACRFERDNFSRFDGVVVPDPTIARRLIEEYDFPPARILVDLDHLRSWMDDLRRLPARRDADAGNRSRTNKEENDVINPAQSNIERNDPCLVSADFSRHSAVRSARGHRQMP
ncbi:MAG: hypothetical protein KatS3mg105_1137 [Gemmatales bacterium]|nr:MAG: hypothetical protein KatS3mg105_1137 [Gemmatales bacterium]